MVLRVKSTLLIFSLLICSGFIVKAADDDEPEEFNMNCEKNVDGYFFDLSPLRNEGTDYQIKFKQFKGSPELFFNVCKKVDRSHCNVSESTSVADLRYYNSTKAEIDVQDADVTDPGYECVHMTNEVTLKETVEWDLLDANDGNKGVTMTLPYGETCKASPERQYKILFSFMCDPTVNFQIVERESWIGSELCFYRIKVRTKYGCPRFDVARFDKFMKMSIKAIFSILNILLGFEQMTVGLKYLYFSTLVAVTVAIFPLSIFVYPLAEVPAWLLMFEFILAAGANHLLGKYRSKKWVKLATFFFIGVGLGVVLTYMALDPILSLFAKSNRPVENFYTMMALTTFTLGAAVMLFRKLGVIVATALQGDLMFIKGISVLFGYEFESFSLIPLLISADKIPFSAYFLMLIAVVMLISAVRFQLKSHENDELFSLEHRNGDESPSNGVKFELKEFFYNPFKDEAHNQV